MKLVIQRISQARVTVNKVEVGNIGSGLLVLLGIQDDDNITDITWLCNKLIGLRIFNDAHGVMNLSVQDVKGGLLIISQFTLMASTVKGNRPSYLLASKPEVALPIYNSFITQLTSIFAGQVATGMFGADMQVTLTNDGPVTIVIDSKHRY